MSTISDFEIGCEGAMSNAKPTYEELEKQVEELREITSRLMSKERQWNALSDNTLDFFLLVNKSGIIKSINRTNPGRDKKNIIGRHLCDFALQEYHEVINHALETVFIKREVAQYESAVDTIDGRKWFVTRLIPWDTEGIHETAILIGSDITERKKAEETEQLVQSINNNLFNGMVYQVIRKNDGTRQFTYLSNKVMDFYGITPAEGMADAALIYDRIHDDDKGRVFLEEEQAHRAQSVFSTEIRVVDHKGQMRWSHFVSHPRETEDGSVVWDGIEFDITKRKNTEADLIASKELARALINIPDGMMILMDANHNILDANSILTKRTGKSLESLLGTCVWDLMPPDVAQRRRERQDQVLQSGKPIRYEDEREGKWTDNTVYPILDEHGNATRVAVYSHDITERKNTESALRNAMRLSEEYINSLPGLFYVFDEQRFVRWNGAWQGITGYSDEELAGMYGPDFFEGDDKQLVQERMRKVFEQGSAEAEAVVVTKHGKRIPYYLTGVRKMFNNKQHLVGLGIDISDRRKVEEELKMYHEHLEQLVKDRTRELVESEKRFKQLADNLPDILMRWVPHAGLVYANPAMNRILGYSNEGPFNEWDSFMAHVHPDDVSTMAGAFQKFATEQQSPQIVEYRIIAKSGNTVWLEAIWSPIWEDGQLLAVDAIARDVTDRKNAEAEKDMLKAQLIQSQKMEAIGQLAGGIAHDFNNILATISGTAELLLKATPPDAPIIKKLERIQNCSHRAKDLTMKLLTFARKEKLNVKAIHPHDIVADVLDILKSTSSATIDVSSEADDTVSLINVDPNQIFHAILNICLNACDAMPQGGKLHIRLQKATIAEAVASEHNIAGGDYVRISIEDTGTGIEAANMEKIFEPFFTTKDMGKGSGLGLSICHGIIKAHGGFVQVRTEPGKGTAFSVFLPVADPDAMAPDHAQDKPVAQTAHGSILLVDDDEEFVHMMKEALEIEGFFVATALSGEQAVNYYRDNGQEIDIILLDMLMPEMRGTDVYLALKNLNPGARVVLCSGFSIDGDASYLLENGALAFIQKPFQIAEATEVLNRILLNNKQSG